MEAEQRKIVEIQEKKLNYIKNNGINLMKSFMKSKFLQMIQNNTANCQKICENILNENCIKNCINKRYVLTEILMEV